MRPVFYEALKNCIRKSLVLKNTKLFTFKYYFLSEPMSPRTPSMARRQPAMRIIMSRPFPNASITPITTVRMGKTISSALAPFFLKALSRATTPLTAIRIPRTRRTICAATQPRTRMAIPIIRLTAPPVQFCLMMSRTPEMRGCISSRFSVHPPAA